MSEHRIHSYTSIGRPLDPACPTNRAVLVLVPLAALLGALAAWAGGAELPAILKQAGSAALISLGAWALARELNPDDNPAAFVAMALGFLAAIFVESPGILVVFVTIGLVRIVNRSTGRAARLPDSIGMLVLSILVIYLSQSPFFGLVAAVAFILDGSLENPLRRHWWYGLICAGATVVYTVDHDIALGQLSAPHTLFGWLALLFIAIFALNAVLLRTLRSVADCDGEPLDPARVRGGMAVGLLAALQGIQSPDKVVVLVAVIAAIGIGMALRKAFRAPAGA